MKILHTADLHLGKRLDRFDRLPEQEQVMEEIVQIAEQEDVDLVLLAGDLFDSYNPPTAAVELLYRTAARLSGWGRRAVVAIAGNHDSPDRIDAPHALAREAGILFVGYPTHQALPLRTASGIAITQSEPGFVELALPRVQHPVRILLTPFANEFRLGQDLGTEDREEALRQRVSARWAELAAQHCDGRGVNLLIAHLLFARSEEDVPEEPEDEKPIHLGNASFFFVHMVPPQVQYTALGHLHRHQNLGSKDKPVVYSGSPLAYSFGESAQQKHVVLLHAEPGQPVQMRTNALASGRGVQRHTAGSLEEAMAFLQAHQDEYVELSVRTAQWITAAERRQLLDAHPWLVGPLPLPMETQQEAGTRRTVDLTQRMETLFAGFFERQKGQQPGERMMALFREMMAQEEEGA